MTAQKHKVTIPGYKIIRKIGEGGMSVVYLAYQESLKREVALKVMRPIITDEENVVRRFEQEAEIIAKLYHPNIVNIYEVGHIDDDILYYSMPFLQHGDLTSFAYHDDEQLIEVMAGICDGLAFAHTQGVVHRDIKPENILFDQFGHVQLADFGIALSTGRRRFTKDSRVIGSVYYMSPEQAQSKHVDARSDIYGLGAILFEILTGEPIFEKESDFAMMMAHVNEPIPELPADLAHWQPVINKCLAKSPNHRYQNVTALKEAILAIKPNSKVTTQNSWLKPITIIASFAVIGLLSVMLWQYKNNENTAEEYAVVVQQQEVLPKSDNSIASRPLHEDDSAEITVVNNLTAIEVDGLIQKAQQNINNKHLTTPRDDNALDQLLLVLKNIPNHEKASSLLSDVLAGYYELVYQSVLNNNHEQAMGFAESVSEVRHRTILTHETLYAVLEQNTELERSLLLGAIAEKVTAAKQSNNRQQATRLIALVDAVIPGHEIINELNSVMQKIPKPGHLITDSEGLISVIIPPEINGVKGHLKNAIAVSQTEVSYALFDQFVVANNHEIQRCKSPIGSNMIFSQRNYSKPGFAVHENTPVVCITWNDANLFIKWYNQLTGEKYRLPSPLEWRHLIKLSQIKHPNCGQANMAGKEFPADEESITKHDCDDDYPFVSPLKAFKSNTLGLHGLHGNVAEWLAGCQEMGKFKAIFNPDDRCESNPIAGLSWISGPDDSGEIKQIKTGHAWSYVGFRLVKNP